MPETGAALTPVPCEFSPSSTGGPSVCAYSQ